MNNPLTKHEHNGYRLKILPELINGEFLDCCCRETLPDDGDSLRVPTSAQAKVFFFHHNGQRYFHKTFCPRNRLESVKNFIRGSRAARSVKGHSLLLDNGFLAPQVVLVGHKKQHNFIVTAAVPKCMSLNDFLQNTSGWDAHIFCDYKKHQIEQLGNLIGRMHATNIVHGDLLCGNLLLSGDQPGEYKIYFIDNERTEHHLVFTAKARLKNLVQLNKVGAYVANTDRMRFFQQYARHNPVVCSAKKLWLKKIIVRTAQRIAKKHRKQINHIAQRHP